jgi:parallel beta-helix repeat protein
LAEPSPSPAASAALAAPADPTPQAAAAPASGTASYALGAPGAAAAETPAAAASFSLNAAAVIATPVVFNASNSARAGDIITLQGENFGNAPVVWLDTLGATPSTALTVLNRVGTGWLAVQIPAGLNGALGLRISNGGASSALIHLNIAAAHHLDTTQLVPGGSFRIMGRNLMLPGYTPSVKVAGMPATVNLAASNEHMLTVSAPSVLSVSQGVTVSVDNGSGNGATNMERTVAVASGSQSDPLNMGVGWATSFARVMARNINAATDTRLATRVVCDGRADNAKALQDAVLLAFREGGASVTLPAGVCKLSRGVQLLSNTVLQGAGKDRTELQFNTDSPLYASGADLFAVRNLTLTNTGSSPITSLNFNANTRVALDNIKINQGAKAKAWLHKSTNIVVRNSEFLQTGSLGAPGAVHAAENTGLVFVGNRISFMNDTGTNFDHVRDAFVSGNTWSRDAIYKNDPGVVHTITLNFAHRFALVGNTFTTVNGPLDRVKNDGETILSEGGGARRTESLGSVSRATATSLTDSSGTVNPNARVNGALPENYGIAIVAGKGMGQTRRVVAFTAGTFSIDTPWAVTPDSTSRYAAAVWGLEKTLIKGNTLTNNRSGIWLYSTAVRDMEINGNTLQENGGILIRSFQQVNQSWFSPIYNVRVVGNKISNTKGYYPSYLSVFFANNDGLAYGTAHIGVELRNNQIVANQPNISFSHYIGPAGAEGYMNQMSVSNSTYVASTLPRVLGTVFQQNSCNYCSTAVRLGTGAIGTMLADTQLLLSDKLWTNQPTSSSTDLAAVTWVR